MNEKIQILEKILGECKPQGSEYLFFCPNCNHYRPKLSISIEKNKYKCWLGCGLVGNSLTNLVYKFGNKQTISLRKELKDNIKIEEFDDLFIEKPVFEDKPIVLPDGFHTLASNKLSNKSQAPIEYLVNRHISYEQIYKWKIGFCDSGNYRNRIIVPSYSLNGKLNYFVGRDYTGNSNLSYFNSKKSKNIIFNDLMIDWNKPVTIVEGVFDAIKCDNSIPILGKTLMSSSLLFNKIIENKTPVYLGLDLDAEDSSIKIINKLIDFNIPVYKIDVFPFKDLGEMTKEQILEKKNEAKPIGTKTDLLEFIILSKL